MPSSATLEINVVYDASKRRRRAKRTVRPGGGPGSGSRSGLRSRKGLILLGLINLTLAAGLYYGTWWQADPELRIRLIGRMPIPGLDMAALDSDLASLFGGAPIKPKPQLTAEQIKEQRLAQAAAVKEQTRQAAIISGTVITWEALSTLTACLLALSGGTMLGSAGSSTWRKIGLLCMLVSLLALAGGIYHIWTTYGLRYRVDHFRYAIAGLIFWTACLGWTFGRGVRGWGILAGLVVVLFAAGSAVALYISQEYGLITSAELPLTSWTLLAVVFLAQSLWGWILLPVAARIRR